MNFSICKKILLSAILSFHATPLLQANDTQIPQEVIAQHNEVLEHTLKNILNQYNAIDLILQDLAIVVNNDLIYAMKNKRVVLDEIKNIRSIIEEAQNNTYTHINPGHIALLIKVLDGIVEHLSKALSKGFTTLPTFDLDNCVKRAFASEVDLNNLDQDIIDVRKKIDGLDQNAKSAGLTWYNKIYRKVDDYVIQPSIRYSVPQRSGKVLLGAAVLFYIWWHTERGTRSENEPIPAPEYLEGVPSLQKFTEAEINVLEKEDLRKIILKALYEHKDYMHEKAKKIAQTNKYWSIEYMVRDWFGAYPHVDKWHDLLDKNPNDFHYKGKNPLGKLGRFEMWLMRFAGGQMPITTYALPFVPMIYKEELSHAYDWVSRKVIELHNFLRGGAYRKLEVRTENMQMEPKITFADLVGLDHAKKELSLIVEYIKDPERWDRSKLAFEKGFLLTGPTRTGKSYTAEALAGEIRKLLKSQNRNPEEFGFYSISGSYIVQNGIAKLLEAAKREAPCVLFIDEIDLLGLQRTGNKDLLHELLQSMSGAFDNDPKKQVILLAATNKPENIEEALKQRGRFGVEIRYEYPNANDRRAFLVKRLGNLVINLDSFDLDKLVRETEGCSFEDLNAMVKKAFQKSKINGHAITQESLELALDTEIRHIIFDPSKNLPEHELKLLAVHQAGHALASVILELPQKLAKVTIRPVLAKLKEESPWDGLYKKAEDKQKTIDWGKIFTYHPFDTLNLCTKTEKINLIKMHLAGHAAEEVLLGSCGYDIHKHEDKENAVQIAASIVFEGMKLDGLPKKIHNQMLDEAFALVKKCKEEVMQLFNEHKEKLQTIADVLKQKFSLSADEVMVIVDPAKATALKKIESPKLVDPSMIAKDIGIAEVAAPQAQAVEIKAPKIGDESAYAPLFEDDTKAKQIMNHSAAVTA